LRLVAIPWPYPVVKFQEFAVFRFYISEFLLIFENRKFLSVTTHEK